jgi:hypothetical protein
MMLDAHDRVEPGAASASSEAPARSAEDPVLAIIRQATPMTAAERDVCHELDARVTSDPSTWTSHEQFMRRLAERVGRR